MISDQTVYLLNQTAKNSVSISRYLHRIERCLNRIRELHWLPLAHRIKFKVAVLMYLAHNRLSPLYISEMLAPVSSTLMHRQLRSSGSSNYTVPRTRIYNSSVIELSQLLDQSSGTPSLNPSDQSTTYTRSNAFWIRTFLNNSTDFTSLHSAAISSMLLCTA